MVDAATNTRAAPAEAQEADEQLAMPLSGADDQELGDALVRPDPISHSAKRETLEPGRSLVISDFAPPSTSAAERLIRMAYRLGVPASTLSSPFSKPPKPRLLGTVETPYVGERAAGVALRAGHFLVHGVKAPIAQMDFSATARLTPPFERTIHGFTWLRHLAASAPREQCVPTAERIMAAWLGANGKPGKGTPWKVEHVGHRLMNWLVHAPLILSNEDPEERGLILEVMAETARWLDRNITKADDRQGEVAGWCAIVAAGLLMPEGRPRKLFGEAGLIRALGELVADDGGVLSRSPLAQIDTIALLVDLRACYNAVGLDAPDALEAMLQLLVPPLHTVTHSDGALASWQGAGAVRADRLAALVDASGVRARPLKDVRQWGYQRVAGNKTTLVMDAAPPALSRNARSGCASTLAFELCAQGQRIIVNCGGAAFAGGQVPARIEQGLRATAAHSTLTLDDANSTAVHLAGKLGAGVNEVEIDRKTMQVKNGLATRIEASHDGYANRFGLNHRRMLIMREDGSELRGEDLLVPVGKKGKRGKIGFAIRFHIGPGIELGLSDDERGAGLALPDGSYWQFRVGTLDGGLAESAPTLSIEESMWVDGGGRPHPIEQLVIQGMTSRGGGSFSWLLKKMG